ncbi:MAG: MBL fold metallo-hydrolase [Acidobacteriota bacterium]|nr:MBL fold metallo-hydrolase [Acidobacteriota bacterium]
MNRRRFLVSSSAAAVAAACPRLPAFARQAATALPPLVTRFEEVRRGVGVFTGNGGTIGYLVNDAGAMAVDSQFVPGAEACVAGLKTRAPNGVQLLINTHHHLDHTKGNVAFRPLVKRIVAHETCAAWHRTVAAQEGTATLEAFADTTFATTWSEAFGDEAVEARYHGAGHTSGDAVITFQKANVVHMGDLLAVRAHPNIDRPVGGSVIQWIAALEQVTKAASNDTIFIAGHAKDGAVLARRADVLHFRDYFTAALNYARKGLAAGQPKAEVQQLDTLPGFDDFIVRIPRFTLAFVLGICYDEVAGTG